MKKQTIITLAVCLLAVALTVYFLFFHKKEEEKETSTKDAKTTSKTTAPVSVFPLKQGSKGTEVKNLQRKMNEWMTRFFASQLGIAPSSLLVEDGVFGPKTLDFVQKIFNSNTVSQTQYSSLMSQNFTTSHSTTSSWDEKESDDSNMSWSQKFNLWLMSQIVK